MHRSLDHGLAVLELRDQTCRVPRRAGCQRSLLQDEDGGAALRQRKGGRGAHDATAHADPVHRLRQGRCVAA